MLEIDREQAVAYRVAAHQLDRSCTRADRLAVLDLGVQDPRAGSALTALAARLPKPASGKGFASTWTFRGAPHLHRVAELARLNEALWPLDERDATVRLGNSCADLRRAGVSGEEAIRNTAEAWREVTADGEVRTKGEISAAVTERLPETYSSWCRGCGSTHILELLMRLAGLPAGARIAEVGPPVAFRTESDWPGPPDEPVGTARLVEAYLRLHGPATPADAAGYLGTSATVIKPVWPDGLRDVRLDGRRTWIREADADLLESPPTPRLTRLLPAYDPFLQARDRTTLVPEKTRHKKIWQILGNPGAVLVDGEVVGVWRAKAAGKRRLAVTVEFFESSSGRRATAVRKEIGAEAEVVAAVRGVPEVEVSYAD